MKRILPHVIYVVIIAFFIFYAKIKASEAEKQALEVNRIQTELKEVQAASEKQSQFAEKRAAEAIREKVRADHLQEQLQQCQNK